MTLGGYVYHVLNRANGRLRIFRKESDFLALEQILADGTAMFSMRLYRGQSCACGTGPGCGSLAVVVFCRAPGAPVRRGVE